MNYPYLALVVAFFAVLFWPANSQAACHLQEGKAYKSNQSSAVYYITKDCTKKAYAHPDIFFSYFSSWNDVVLVNQDELHSVPNDKLTFLPIGPLYKPKSGSLMKTIDDPKVYLLLNGHLYWINSEEIFNSLGYKWNWIEDVDERVVESHENGGLIDYDDHHPNYSAVKYAYSPKVYIIEPDPNDSTKQIKKYISSETAFNQVGYRIDRVVMIEDSEIYADGQVVVEIPVVDEIEIPSSVSTYQNEQNINFSAFPKLDMNAFTGRSFYVATNGDDNNDGSLNKPLRNITTAISRAGSKDKIFIRGGTYESNYWDLTKPVYIGGYNNELVTVNIVFKENRRAVQMAEEAVLENIVFNVTTPAGIGIYTSKDLVFKNIKLNMNGSGYSEGLVAYNPSSGLLVENSEINKAVMGLSCNTGPCTDWKIVNTKIKNRNAGDGSGADCFAIENGTNIFLENVETTGCSADGIDIKGTNVLLINPFVHNVSRNGIKLWNGGDIINALVYDTGADVSVYLGEQGKTRLINSTIAFPSHHGRAYVLASGYSNTTGAMDIEIINSIIYQNPDNNGAILYFPNINGTTRKLAVKNSLFYIPGSEVEISSNTRSVFENPVNNNLLNLDPNFVSANPNGDFRLQAISPALNFGQNTDYGFDRNYVSRISGAFDVGVYEK